MTKTDKPAPHPQGSRSSKTSAGHSDKADKARAARTGRAPTAGSRTPADRRRADLRLDHLDLQLVSALQHDARLSIRELGRRLGVSAPTVSDRLGRLEAAGVIAGYSATVSPGALGYGVVAFINVLFDSGEKFSALDDWAREHPHVLECHHLTGRFAAMMKVAVRDIPSLNEMVMELVGMGVQCDTSIVLTSPVTGKLVSVDVGA